jgi:heme A synthase
VPLSLALLHQAVAMLVLTIVSVHAANAIARRRVIEIIPRGRSRAGVLPTL